MMSVLARVILITYAILTAFVSFVAFKNELTKKYSALGLLGALMLIASAWSLDMSGLFSFIASVVVLAVIQAQTYLNGKSLYDQVHISHHIVRFFLHIAIIVVVAMAAFSI